MVVDEMIPSEAGCLAADCFGELWKKKSFCLACEARRSQVKKGGIGAKTIFHRGRFASWRCIFRSGRGSKNNHRS
jgi:hypothetical protein